MEIALKNVFLTYNSEDHAWEGVLNTTIGNIEVSVVEIGDPENDKEDLIFQVHVGDAYVHRGDNLETALIALGRMLNRMRYIKRDKNGNH